MRLYLDTSTIVKLYVVEPGSDIAERALERATEVHTSLLSYAEARAAFAILLRHKRVTRAVYQTIVGEFNAAWQDGSFFLVQPTQDIVWLAGAFSERYALKGYDATQLASAVVLERALGGVRFLSFDAALSKAASQELNFYVEDEDAE